MQLNKDFLIINHPDDRINDNQLLIGFINLLDTVQRIEISGAQLEHVKSVSVPGELQGKILSAHIYGVVKAEQVENQELINS